MMRVVTGNKEFNDDGLRPGSARCTAPEISDSEGSG